MAENFKWFLLGQSVRRGVRKEATMYSYNGVRLPKLPSVEGHPYKVIFHSSYSTYLFVCSVPVCFRYQTYYGYMMSSASGEKFSYARYSLNANGDGWDGGIFTNDSSNWALGSDERYCLWSDTDLMHYDKDTGEATLSIAASDPIPVYE